MSISTYSKEHLEQYLKFEDNLQSLLSNLPSNRWDLFRQICKFQKKKKIKDSVIKLFYEQPKRFFSDYPRLLENTSYLDETETSIFSHFFYVLYDKNKNGNSSSIDYRIYESNFDSFFKDNQSYFLVQDVNLDTPLIKLAKMIDKSFFFEIFKKLKSLNIIGNETLLINNIEDKSVVTYIIEDIKYNYEKIKNIDLYYNFFKENKSIQESLSNKDQILYLKFMSKIIFETKQYKEENFDDIFNNIELFIKNNIKESIFKYIYNFPNGSCINYLNSLYQICSKTNDYNKLLNLISLLSTKDEMECQFPISKLCLIDHIEYVLKNMNSTKRKGENEMNYSVKLIRQILVKIIQKSESEDIFKSKRHKKGLLWYLKQNNNINFDKKYEFYNILNEITNGLSNNFIDKFSQNIYHFIRFCENKNINSCDIHEIIDNIYLKNIIEENKPLRTLIKQFIKFASKINKGNELEFISKYLKNYIQKKYNLLKHKYDLSNENSERILIMLIRIEISVNNNEINGFTETSSDDIILRMSKDFFLFIEEDLFKKIFMGYVAEHDITEIFDIIFSCPYNLCETLYGDNNPDYLEIYRKTYDYFSKEESSNKPKRKILSLFQKNYPLIKEKPFAAEINAFCLLISDFIENQTYLLPKERIMENFASRIKVFNKNNWIKLINNISEPFDFSEAVNFICDYFLVIYKLLREKSKMLLGILKELDPTLNIGLYTKIVEIVEKYAPIIKNNFEVKYSEFTYVLLKEYAIEFNYLMIFFYIKKKYEKDNPNLVVFLLTHLINFKDQDQIISLYNDAFNRNNLDHVLDNFIFKEFNYDNEIHKAYDYLKNNQSSISKNLMIIKKYKNCSFNDCINQIKPYLNGYIYFNHPNLKINFNHFKSYWDSIKVLNSLIFHLDLTKINNNEENNNNKEFGDNNYNFIMAKISNSYYLFYLLDIETNKLNKNIFNVMTSKIGELMIHNEMPNRHSSEIVINNNIINNLYELLLFNKNERNKFLDISKKSECFGPIIVEFFRLILDYLNKNKTLSIDNKKIEFIKKEIYEFCTNGFENYKKTIILSYEYFTTDFTNQFINKIKKLKDKSSIQYAVNDFKSFVLPNEKIYPKYPKCFYSQVITILEILLEIEEESFIDLLISFKGELKNDIDVNERLMSKNIKKYINCLPRIVSSFSISENLLIKNIIKSKKYELIDSSIVKETYNNLNNYESFILLLNYADNNKDASKYIFNALKTNFYKDEEILFIDFITKIIKNQYVFDTILKTINKKKDNNYFMGNKNIIIKSLYRYSEINGYYYIEQLLKYINKFMSSDEISSFILPPDSSNSQLFNFDHQFIEDLSIDEDNQDEKYLLCYASLNNNVQNYETIAVLINYCQKEKAILSLFPCVYELNKLFNFRTMSYISYFSNSKNKDKIKSLNKFMYNFSLFLESICNNNEFIASLENIEKSILFYYLHINVLEITPPILFKKHIDNSNFELTNILKKIASRISCDINKHYIDEIHLCILFALYEIKGTPLIPIQKYMPEFYMKIENYCKTFKKLKIPEICLKQSLDIKFHDAFINSLKNNRKELIQYFYDCYNIIFIIEKEYGNIFEIEGQTLYLQKAIYNLINNNNISSFVDDNLKSYNKKSSNVNDYDNDNYYGQNESDTKFSDQCITIFSLKDFTRSSSIHIQKSFSEEKYGRVSDILSNILRDYINYLHLISSICNCIILNSKSNLEKNIKDKGNKNSKIIVKSDIFILKDLLFQNDINRLKALKNGIKIDQIKYYILNGIKQYKSDETAERINVWEKWLDFYLKQSHITQIINDNNMTFIKYITCLNVYCVSIINWLNKLKTIFNDYDLKNNNMYKIKFIEETNKEKAKKMFGQNLFSTCQEYINRCKSIRDRRQYDFSGLNYLINIYYHFDDNLGDYVETSSNIELFYFMYYKIKNIDNILNYEDNIDYSSPNPSWYNVKEKLIDINFMLESKDIKSLFLKLFEISDISVNSNDFNKLFTNLNIFFDKYFVKYRQFIPNYMKTKELIPNDVSNPYINELNIAITDEFKNFFTSCVLPIFYLNNILYYYNENKIYDFDFSKMFVEYKEYVNFSNLINDIYNTKFHKNDNLNELFKIRAINYLLNDDSLLNIFIGEIYTSIKYKICSGGINNKFNIRDTFEIKITKGKSYGKSDFNNFKKIEEEHIKKDIMLYTRPKKKKKVILKLKTNEDNKNNNVHFAVFKKNLFKREFIPNIRYQGHIPSLKFSCELSKSRIMSQAFGNEFMVVKNQPKEILLPESNKTIKSGKKHKELNIESFVNVFDLIYTVKSIGKKEIILCKNDISSILDQYSEPSKFISLLNHTFPQKRDEDVKIDFEMIKKYVNENH